jgi:hypothetical protein
MFAGIHARPSDSLRVFLLENPNIIPQETLFRRTSRFMSQAFAIFQYNLEHYKIYFPYNIDCLLNRF